MTNAPVRGWFCFLFVLKQDPYAPLPPKDWILPIDSCRRGLPAVMEAIPGMTATATTRDPGQVDIRLFFHAL